MTTHHHKKKKGCDGKCKKGCKSCSGKKKQHHSKKTGAAASSDGKMTYFQFIKKVYAKPSKYPDVYNQIKDVLPVTKRAPILSKAYKAMQ